MDISKLDEGLNNLRGLDFELAEMQERATGNNFPDVTFSKGFQARLAAMALNVNVHDIKGLPLKQYAQICQTVFNFLFAPSADATPVEKSEA